MAKDREKRPAGVLGMVKRALPALLLVAGIVSVCLVGGLVAKYVTSVSRSDNQIGADDFYFSVDLLEAEAGQDENTILSREVILYGAGQNSLTFTVRNFFDDLRISGKTISYDVEWSPTVTLKQGNATLNGNKLEGVTLTGGASNETAYTLSFIDTAADGTATVTVSSTAPYAKTMTLKVVFHAETYDVLYRVEDAPGNPYATLIVMVGKAGGVGVNTLVFDWSAAGDGLQIDSTNPYVLTGDGGATGALTFAPAVDYQLANTRTVGENGSISILFFKTDMSKDYSKANTVATLTDGKYQILIEPTN